MSAVIAGPADLNTFWRDALAAASENVDEQIAATAMMLTALQLLKSGMGKAGAADLLQALGRAVRNGEIVSVTIGDVVLNLKDDATPRQ